jgi:hypothetical protein
MLRVIHNVTNMSATPAFGSIEMATPSSTSPILMIANHSLSKLHILVEALLKKLTKQIFLMKSRLTRSRMIGL